MPGVTQAKTRLTYTSLRSSCTRSESRRQRLYALDGASYPFRRATQRTSEQARRHGAPAEEEAVDDAAQARRDDVRAGIRLPQCAARAVGSAVARVKESNIVVMNRGRSHYSASIARQRRHEQQASAHPARIELDGTQVSGTREAGEARVRPALEASVVAVIQCVIN